MPVNLFDTNSDLNTHDLQGLNNSQTGSNFSPYGWNEDRSLSSGANISLSPLSYEDQPNFISNDFSVEGVGFSSPSRVSDPTFSTNNDYLTGISDDKYVVDAWSSSTTPQPTTPTPIVPQSATPPATTNNSFVQRVVDLTNAQRLQAGLQPLRLNSNLSSAATGHSEDMAVHDYFNHNGLNGSTVSDRALAAGYKYSYLGENIAAGQTTPEDVVQGWMNSSGHRANILNPNYQEIGVGYYYLANDTGNVNYHSYWTEDFGKAA